MINTIIQTELNSYNPINLNETKNALKEILQKIILCGLARSSFFNYFSFYGGTSLRLNYGLRRFSEDLDFVLSDKKGNKHIDKLDAYFKYVIDEFSFFSIDAKVVIKEKTFVTNTRSIYVDVNLFELLKLCGLDNVYSVNKNEILSIKLDIELNYIDGCTRVCELLGN